MGIKPSATLTISAKAKELKKQGLDVIGFGAGEPDFDTPDSIKTAAKLAIEQGFTKYTAAAGMPELKNAIAKKFLRENNITYDPSQIIVSNGAKQSLMNISLALLEDGDEVIIPKPFWLSYDEQVQMCGATPVFAESDELQVKASLIEEKITSQTKMLIINSPCNPSGKIIPKEELEKIAALCVKHNIICVSDEPYETILFDDNVHVSIASLNKDIYDLTITVNAVSKTYSMTGWRIGYCAGPLQVIKAMSNMQSHTTSGPSTISQKAAIQALSGKQDAVEVMRKEFEKRRDYVHERLNKIVGVQCSKPQGSFYAFPNISTTSLSSVAFCEQLLDKELVAMVPGEPFGNDDCIRMSFATSFDNLLEGLDRMERFCKTLGDKA